MSGSTHPTVSVIIPAYRAAATIGRTIDSLLAQTRRADEIIVIDDGSPDNMAAALAPYGDRVRLVRQANGGAARARNGGIELATGELIAFVDADDYWEPDKLERQLAILERHPEVGLTAARYYIELPGKPRYPHTNGPAHLFDRVLRARGAEVPMVVRQISTATVLVRRAVLGGHRFDTGLTTAEDVDLWIRLVLSAPVYLLPETLATVVLVAGSLSRSDVAGDSCNMLEVVRRHGHLLGWAKRRAWKANVYREWAAGHLGNGEPREAVWPAWSRLRHQPWSAQGWWVLCKSAAWAGNAWFTGRKSRARKKVRSEE